jgi:hypothetical protein
LGTGHGLPELLEVLGFFFGSKGSQNAFGIDQNTTDPGAAVESIELSVDVPDGKRTRSHHEG